MRYGCLDQGLALMKLVFFAIRKIRDCPVEKGCTCAGGRKEKPNNQSRVAQPPDHLGKLSFAR